MQTESKFQGTANLANQLINKKKAAQNKLQQIANYREEYLKHKEDPANFDNTKAEIFTDAFEFNREIALVRSLGENTKFASSEKTKQLLADQKEGRRSKHIEQLREYDNWQETFKDGINDRMKGRWKTHESIMKDSAQNITELFSSMTDQILLKSEYKDVLALLEKIDDIKKIRKEEINKLKDNLNETIQLKAQSAFTYLEKHKAKLIEIAFLVDSESTIESKVEELIKNEIEKHKKILEEDAKTIEDEIKKVRVKEEAMLQEFNLKFKNLSDHYHTLKHIEAINNLKEYIKGKECSNPVERKEVIAKIKEDQQNIYQKRREMIARLSKAQIKEDVEAIDDEFTTFNSDMQKQFKKQVDHINAIEQNIQNNITQKKIEVVDFLTKNKAIINADETYEGIVNREIDPLAKQRADQGKELMIHIAKYYDVYESKMVDYCRKLIAIYRNICTQYSKQITDLKVMSDNNIRTMDGSTIENEKRLEQQQKACKDKLLQMQNSFTIIQLKRFYEEGHKLVIQINKDNDIFVDKYKKLLEGFVPNLKKCFDTMEISCLSTFKMYDKSKISVIEDRLRKEMESKVKQEEEKKVAEDPKAKVKAPAAAKKKQVEPEQIKLPTIPTYKSKLENEYFIDFTLQEITSQLTAEEKKEEIKEIKEEKKEEVKKAAPKTDKLTQQQKDEIAKKEEEEKKKKEEEEKVIRAEKEKAEKMVTQVPRDPDNQECLYASLVYSSPEIFDILKSLFDQCIAKIQEWYSQANSNLLKQNSEEFTKVLTSIKSAIQINYPELGISDLDVLSNRLIDVEINKKRFDAHVRKVMNNTEIAEEDFNKFINDLNDKASSYFQQLGKFQHALDECKNLSELQGFQRKASDSFKMMEDYLLNSMNALKDLSLINEASLSESKKSAYNTIEKIFYSNIEFIAEAKLISNKGGYSEDEVKYYKQLLSHINNRIKDSCQVRFQKQNDLIAKYKLESKQKLDEFNKETIRVSEILAAKEGLGKKYGKPKRQIQEKVKGETSKCDEALNKITQTYNSISQLYQQYPDISSEQLSKGDSLSLTIRKKLIIFWMCTQKLIGHLDGFNESFTPLELPRITLDEQKKGIELNEQENAKESERKSQELAEMGRLGDPTEPPTKMQERVKTVMKEIKTQAVLLYTGPNASLLQGEDKIPQYLEIYISNTLSSTEEFRFVTLREMRTLCEKMIELCLGLSQTIFGSIMQKQKWLCEEEAGKLLSVHLQYLKLNKETKEKFLHLLRPNLSNPSCKTELDELNNKELSRRKEFSDKIDNAQVQLLQIYIKYSQQFYSLLLNNSEAFASIFASLFHKEDIARLPGDEIITKKHMNLKQLLIKKENKEGYQPTISRSVLKVWPGLPKSAFEIALNKYEEYSNVNPQAPPETEMVGELKAPKIPIIKELIHQRNEAFNKYKEYFDGCVMSAFTSYRNEKKEDIKYSEFWDKNVEYLRKKSSV